MDLPEFGPAPPTKSIPSDNYRRAFFHSIFKLKRPDREIEVRNWLFFSPSKIPFSASLAVFLLRLQLVTEFRPYNS